jgi:hypothetical protein
MVPSRVFGNLHGALEVALHDLEGPQHVYVGWDVWGI